MPYRNLADEMVQRLQAADPSLTKTKIAERLGISQPSFYRACRAQEFRQATARAWVEKWNAGGHHPQLKLIPAEIALVSEGPAD